MSHGSRWPESSESTVKMQVTDEHVCSIKNLLRKGRGVSCKSAGSYKRHSIV